MLQRDPKNPKHREFHDGEHEYNPIKSKSSRASISIPAALLSGLELVAAAAATVLAVAALFGICYVDTAPVVIFPNQATVNVVVHDYGKEAPVYYELTPRDDPENILAQGMLDGKTDRLEFTGLTENTDYTIFYYIQEDGELTKIKKDFRFTTGSDPVDIILPTEAPVEKPTTLPAEDPKEPTVKPVEPPTEAPTEPSTDPAPTEPSSEPTEPSSEPTEPSEEPTEPRPRPTRPPTENTTRPTTRPTEPPTEPTTQPSEPPEDDTEEESAPTAQPLQVLTATHRPPESGETAQAYYQCLVEFSFTNLPSENYTVSATVDGAEVTEYNAYIAEEVLYVELSRDVAAGEENTTAVTVTWDTGATCTSTQTITPPMMEGVDLNVTRNDDGTFTFDMVLTVAPGDEPMDCVFLLVPSEADEEITLVPTQASSTTYTASHTTAVSASDPTATAFVTALGVWEQAGTVQELDSPPSVSEAVEYGMRFEPNEPEIDSITYQDGTYTVVQIHSAASVPEGTPTVEVLVDGVPWTNYELRPDGLNYSVIVEHPVSAGSESVCQVTATWPDGTTFTTTQSLTAPGLDSVQLEVTDAGDSDYTYTVTGTLQPGDGDLVLQAILTPWEGAEPVELYLTKDADGSFFGSTTLYITELSGETTAEITITGFWDKVTTASTWPSISTTYTYSIS